jgi:DNA-directed RNA polymerase subunit L
MPTFTLPDEGHTLASALREALEELYPDDFVACTLVHPLDAFLHVDAPSEGAVRAALLRVRDRIAAARASAP